MNARDHVTTALDDANVHFEPLPHPRTDRALAEARALGLPSGEVAKTLVLRTPEGFLRAVLPASERLDLPKVRRVVGGGKRSHLATEEDLAREYSEFELGAVPPFGNGSGPTRAQRRVVRRTGPVRGPRGAARRVNLPLTSSWRQPSVGEWTQCPSSTT